MWYQFLLMRTTKCNLMTCEFYLQASICDLRFYVCKNLLFRCCEKRWTNFLAGDRNKGTFLSNQIKRSHIAEREDVADSKSTCLFKWEERKDSIVWRMDSQMSEMCLHYFSVILLLTQKRRLCVSVAETCRLSNIRQSMECRTRRNKRRRSFHNNSSISFCNCILDCLELIGLWLLQLFCTFSIL